jgi:hypothetical protein
MSVVVRLPWAEAIGAQRHNWSAADQLCHIIRINQYWSVTLPQGAEQINLQKERLTLAATQSSAGKTM